MAKLEEEYAGTEEGVKGLDGRWMCRVRSFDLGSRNGLRRAIQIEKELLKCGKCEREGQGERGRARVSKAQ